MGWRGVEVVRGRGREDTELLLELFRSEFAARRRTRYVIGDEFKCRAAEYGSLTSAHACCEPP